MPRTPETTRVNTRVAAIVVAAMTGLVPFTGSVAAETGVPNKVGNLVVLGYGKDGGPQAKLSFNKNRAATAALQLDTISTGKAGAIVRIYTDGDPKPALEHTFTPAECRAGPPTSGCMVRFNGRSATYGRLLAAFRKGKVSRLDVVSDGSMAMSEQLDLAGFRRAMPR